MIFSALLGIFFITAVFAFLAWKKAVSFTRFSPNSLHSRPFYHSIFNAVSVLMTGCIVLLVVGITSAYLIDLRINTALDQYVAQSAKLTGVSETPLLSQIERDLIIGDARAFAMGNIPSTTDAVREQLGTLFAQLDQQRTFFGLVLVYVSSFLCGLLIYRRLTPAYRARTRTEKFIKGALGAAAVIAILTTLGIVLSLVGETFKFFSVVPISDFLFGTTWSPLSGVFEGKIDPDKVGTLPLFTGTLLITFIAMSVAIPCGLFAAIYLSDFASVRTRAFAKPLLEILAGVPTVVYGFFAAITVAPIIRDFGEFAGLNVDAQSALAAGIVMGIMIIPFISSLSDDVINAVPQNLRDGAFALGATQGEAIWKVVLPAALPGIISAVLLGVSRAVGETMIVVMAAGQGANLTANPLESVTTVTVQIVALITGDTEADTAAGPAFALGFVLFCMTLLFNVAALLVARKYRERYE